MTNNTTPNVPRELKPCPFCGENLEVDYLNMARHKQNYNCILRTFFPVVDRPGVAEKWNRRAPSPAGVDGLEVVGVRVTSDGFGSYIADSAMGIPKALQGEVREPLCRLSSASSIIIGLQEKIERLQFSLDVAKTDELSAAVYAETESIKHSLWAAEKERDQQAQRIGELREEISDLHRKLDKFYSKSHGIPALAEIERLSEERDHLAALLRLTKTIDWAGLDLDEWSDRVDAALSAGHEPKQCT